MEAELLRSFEEVEKNRFDPASVERLSPLFERLNRTGARIEHCYAVTCERERYASFRRQCAGQCDLRALSDVFGKWAEKVLADAAQI